MKPKKAITLKLKRRGRPPKEARKFLDKVEDKLNSKEFLDKIEEATALVVSHLLVYGYINNDTQNEIIEEVFRKPTSSS